MCAGFVLQCCEEDVPLETLHLFILHILLTIFNYLLYTLRDNREIISKYSDIRNQAGSIAVPVGVGPVGPPNRPGGAVSEPV